MDLFSSPFQATQGPGLPNGQLPIPWSPKLWQDGRAQSHVTKTSLCLLEEGAWVGQLPAAGVWLDRNSVLTT